VVARQRAAGLDVVGDGEQTKTGFYTHIGERLSGFEPRPGRDPLAGFRAEIDSFPEYYEQYRAGRPGERRGQRRLRVLLAGHVHPGDPPADRMGQVRGAGRGRPPGHRAAVALGSAT
jgi:hypothetical protein